LIVHTNPTPTSVKPFALRALFSRLQIWFIRNPDFAYIVGIDKCAVIRWQSLVSRLPHNYSISDNKFLERATPSSFSL